MTAMTGAYWEMERRRLMNNRNWEVAQYAALEYPREPLAAVLRMAEPPAKPNGGRLRGPRPGRTAAPSGATEMGARP
jgi:hypothetical protein